MFRKCSVALVLVAFATGSVVVHAADSNVLEEPILRASRTIGLDVVNQQNETLGKVGDLVVGQDGERITHIILIARGTEGNAERRHPVPIEAVRIVGQGDARPAMPPATPPATRPATPQATRPADQRVAERAESRGRRWAVRIDLTRDRVAEAPALEDDDLTILADEAKLKQIAEFYRVMETTKRRERPVLTVKDLLDFDVRRAEKTGRVAKLEDLVFEIPSGRIRYGALDFTVAPERPEGLFPVPWVMFTISVGEERYLTFERDVTQEMLQAAERFAEDETWPATADTRWLTGDFRQPLDERVGEREQPLLR